MDAFKSYATRALRRAGLLAASVKPWVRHAARAIYGRNDTSRERLIMYSTGRVMSCRRSMIESKAEQSPDRRRNPDHGGPRP